MGYSALHTFEDMNGREQTVLVIEGAANDVAAYILPGSHGDRDHVLAHGVKMTERHAQLYVGWPARLEYRR